MGEQTGGASRPPRPRPALALLAVLLALGGAGCATAPPEVPTRASRRAVLAGAESFVTVLSVRADDETFDGVEVAILDAAHYSMRDVAALRERGVLTLGYVNVGEVEDWRPFADRVDPAWELGENPLWAGHRFVDAREPGWQALVVETVAQAVVAKEFDGLFLDMADVAAVFPETAGGVVDLIRALRERYPTHVLVMNRGLVVLDRVAADVDGLLVEGVFARYDLAAGRYEPTPPAARARLTDALRAFRDSTGGAAFVIDYADTPALRALAEGGAAEAGLPIFVSTVELADVPPAPDDRLAW